MSQPLADKLRPTNIDAFFGQQHLLNNKSLFAHIHSMLLWGPAGCGKTTLAKLIAQHHQCEVISLSAVSAGVSEVRSVITRALTNQKQARVTVLFVDEIHRFNKAQQDIFLPHIESGLIYLIGATTENPSFSVNQALRSRLQLYRLNELSQQDLTNIINQAAKNQKITLSKKLTNVLIELSSGDGRRALNLLERVINLPDLDDAQIINALDEKAINFDKGGDAFYQQLSAFHKSVRGSSPDGALYWLARMLISGADIQVIARRLLAIASEDIGNADPRALSICLDAWEVFHRVGDKEGNRAIAQAAVYCAIAAKSNAVYKGFNEALNLAKQSADLAPPNHLCNASTVLMEQMGYGKGYRYAHNEENGISKGQTYFPDEMGEHILYQPTDRGLEAKIKAKLEQIRGDK